MRWSGQQVGRDDTNALPGMERTSAIAGLLRTVETPEFAGVRFHEVLAKSALNRVPDGSQMPFEWTINPYRGCTHACVYCFARGTHAWLDLDPGEGFDRDIVVKVNVVEILRRELGRATWRREPVALGTNTDPYQRAEGRYRLMPGILRALVDAGTPVSILTKGTLVRRDLPLIAELARAVPISLAMSIAVHDVPLAQSLEPGAPTAAARLDTVAAAADLGLPVDVFLMPVMPYLTDTRDHLERAAAAASRSGARSAVFSTLHLRPGAREWFMRWLRREHPELVERYRAMYDRSAYAPREYRDWLAAKAGPILRSHGLGGGQARIDRAARGARAALGSSR
jgi:DNA repair photolyase